MLIGRNKELDQIETFIARRRSLIITGQRGAGKTAVLNYILQRHGACYVEYPFTRQILEEMTAYLQIETQRSIRYMSISELLALLRPAVGKERIILLIDEFDSITKHAGKLLERLEEMGVLVIAGGESKKGWIFRFRGEVKLENLSRKNAKTLAQGWIGRISTELVLDLIATKSLGCPGKIREICRDYAVEVSLGKISPANEDAVFNFFEDIKPQIPERINLLPVWMLFCIGFGFLLVRYYFFQWGNWQEGYIMAIFGYTSLIIYRMITARRYEK